MGKKLIIKGADFSVNGIAPEFVQLKCIVATAETQYIVSPVDFPVNGRIVQEFAIPYDSSAENKTSQLFGYNTVGSAVPHKYAMFRCAIIKNASHDWKVFMYANNGDAGVVNTNISIKDANKHLIDASRYGISIDNSSIINLPTPQTTETPKIGLFGRNGDSTSPIVSIGLKLYGVKVYSDYTDNSSLILDCIPVKRIEDDKVCLYDKISGEYIYTSDGTNPNYEELS